MSDINRRVSMRGSTNKKRKIYAFKEENRAVRIKNDHMYKGYSTFVRLEDKEIDDAIYTLQRIAEHG